MELAWVTRTIGATGGHTAIRDNPTTCFRRQLPRIREPKKGPRCDCEKLLWWLNRESSREWRPWTKQSLRKSSLSKERVDNKARVEGKWRNGGCSATIQHSHRRLNVSAALQTFTRRAQKTITPERRAYRRPKVREEGAKKRKEEERKGEPPAPARDFRSPKQTGYCFALFLDQGEKEIRS